MNFSQILATATLALVSALVLVHAGQYSSGYNKGRAHGGPYSAIASHYPSAGCRGYQCNGAANRSPYGPYHSYAVRPVIYGGHGLYNYQGYARHQPAPAAHGARYARSYGAGARRSPRPAYGAGGCYGAQCGQARHYGAARPAASYRQPAAGYALRPVKAVALAPGYGHGQGYSSSSSNNNNYYNNNAYNTGYNANHRGASHQNDAGHHSNQYAAPARQYNQQRPQGGY